MQSAVNSSAAVLRRVFMGLAAFSLTRESDSTPAVAFEPGDFAVVLVCAPAEGENGGGQQ
jgi:hypothetical protein